MPGKHPLQGGRCCNPPCLWHYPFTEEEFLSFHVHVLCYSSLPLLKQKKWECSKVEEEGHTLVCTVLVTARKPFFEVCLSRNNHLQEEINLAS